MSIAPIDYSAFQRNPVGIEAVLSRGGSAFSSILRDAMQVGRDRANRQAAQEKDFLGEQRRDINLNQRRAELQQQDYEDTKNFDEGARRFDTTFGENVRQSDRAFGENVRQFDATSSRANVALGLQRDAGAREERRLDIAEEGAAFERDQLRPLKIKEAQANIAKDKQQIDTEKVRLEAEKARIAGYKDEAKRASETAKYEQDLADVRQGHLTKFDELVRGGDIEAAQSLFRQITENPVYEMDTDTKGRMAAQVGLNFERPSSGSAATSTPPEDMTLDQITEEIGVMESAAKSTSAGLPSEKLALRLEALKREKQRLEKNSPTGRKSEAERLKELGRAGRSGPTQ